MNSKRGGGVGDVTLSMGGGQPESVLGGSGRIVELAQQVEVFVYFVCVCVCVCVI